MDADSTPAEKLFDVDEIKPKFRKHAERAIFYILLDSKNQGDEPLRPLPEPVFDTTAPIARTNVKESLILDLLYSDKLRRA